MESFEEDDGTLVLELNVADDDTGKVIGRGGRTVAALARSSRPPPCATDSACSSTSSIDARDRRPRGEAARPGRQLLRGGRRSMRCRRARRWWSPAPRTHRAPRRDRRAAAGAAGGHRGSSPAPRRAHAGGGRAGRRRVARVAIDRTLVPGIGTVAKVIDAPRAPFSSSTMERSSRSSPMPFGHGSRGRRDPHQRGFRRVRSTSSRCSRTGSTGSGRSAT